MRLPLFDGRTLLGFEDRIVCFDADGRELWSAEIASAEERRRQVEELND